MTPAGPRTGPLLNPKKTAADVYWEQLEELDQLPTQTASQIGRWHASFNTLVPKLWKAEREYLESLPPQDREARVLANRGKYLDRLMKANCYPAGNPPKNGLPALGCNLDPPEQPYTRFFGNYELDLGMLKDVAAALGSSIGDVVWWLDMLNPKTRDDVIVCCLAYQYSSSSSD